MKYNSYGFKSADGINLVCQKWVPENEKALICLIHGLGEHGGSYQQMAEFMAGKGYSLAVLDLRGHGHSDGKRGHSDSFELLMQDIDTFINEILSETPNIPCFLYGHSMGGNLVLNYSLRYNMHFNGVIASGPWLKLAIEPSKFKLKIADVANSIFPSFPLKNGLDKEKLYHKREGSYECSKDPLTHDYITVRLFHNIRKSGLWALEHAKEFKTPLLIMYGSDDEITSPKASVEFADAVDGCTLKIWNGFYHVLHNEPKLDEVFKYTVDWMEKHI